MPTMPRLSDNALTILKTRYLRHGETPADLFRRVASAVAAAEERDREQWAERFYELMAQGLFLPNSPTLFNAGTGAGTLSACFVIPIEDTMESIMAAATTSAMIQKYGGGVGYSFGRLRSKGTRIASTHGKACGAVAVLKMLSGLSEMITQGGKRGGANMGILPVSHPEVLEFIHLKDDFVTAQNFNVSVAVTDRFMDAVERDTEWQLVDPHTHQVADRLPARSLWQAIVDSAWRTGDPGLYFIDEANRHNPTPHLGMLESTNPCGEVPLLPYEACNLGSIDLARFARLGAPTAAAFDFDALDDVVRVAIRFLDDVVNINEFPTPEVREAVGKTRKIGLGVMGWHDALIRLGIPYADAKARELAERVMSRIDAVGDETSRALARERGPYPASVGDPMRNATRTCIAPTGSISAIAGASSGIEPVFALAYVKNVLDGKRLREVNPYLEAVAKERGFWSQSLMDEVVRTGSVQGIDTVPADVKRLFATAMEIPYAAHVAMQAVFQRHTGLAVSKTINMTHAATPHDVEDAYWLAYRSKCKGITVYRDASKPAQVLEVPGSQPATTTAERAARVKRERPRSIRGVTDRVRTSQGNAYITVNFDESGEPFEVFTTISKAGGNDQANLEAVSRLVSLALRSGVPAVEIVEQLRGITSEPVWDSGRLIMSAPDAVAQVLAAHSLGAATATGHATGTAFAAQPRLPMDGSLDEPPDGAAPIFADPVLLARQQRCPDCGGPLVLQEGCIACSSCGLNKCG
ncbi:MAG: adenosylcobalamin-dependent ribonucleoside-diphosphate reductase [SAR202 cluster bacterium]|nr:adenosylcobalamin-dependent ribonucleoside-diphosphate reductase [SAR202 cluster bacterium]